MENPFIWYMVLHFHACPVQGRDEVLIVTIIASWCKAMIVMSNLCTTICCLLTWAKQSLECSQRKQSQSTSSIYSLASHLHLATKSVVAFFYSPACQTVTATLLNYQNHLFPRGHQDTHLLQHLLVSSFNQRLWPWKDGERSHSMWLPHSPKTNRHHLLKHNLGHYCHIIFEMAKEKKGGDARNWTQGLWLKPLSHDNHQQPPLLFPVISLLLRDYWWDYVLIVASNCRSQQDGQHNHSMESPMDRTPSQSRDQWRSSNQR